MKKAKELLRTVDSLYDAVTDKDRWPVFMTKASDLFGSQGIQITHHDLRNQRVAFCMVHGYDWSVELYRRYQQLAGEDPRIPYFNAHPFQPMSCRSYLDEKDLHESRVYKEILSPEGIEYTLGVNLLDPEKSMTYFLAIRTKEQPSFTDADSEIMQELMPHLNRAIILQKELEKLDFERQVSVDILDSMALGIVVIDASSTVHFINETAKDITSNLDGISVHGSKLSVRGDDGQCFYKKLKNQLSASSEENQAGDAFQISRPSGREAYSALLSPYKSSGIYGINRNQDDHFAVLLIRDLDHPLESRTEVLQRLYGLTLSQARLTNLLANGKSLTEAATDLNLTVDSARQYLKLIFQKTETSRQAELVRKVILTPKARSWGQIGA